MSRHGGETSDGSISTDEEFIRNITDSLVAKEKQWKNLDELIKESSNLPPPLPKINHQDSPRKEFNMAEFEARWKEADRKFEIEQSRIRQKRIKAKNEYMGTQLDRLNDLIMKEHPLGSKNDSA